MEEKKYKKWEKELLEQEYDNDKKLLDSNLKNYHKINKGC